MNKEKILQATGRKIKRFTIPQWDNMEVAIRSWSAKELQAFTDWQKAADQSVELFGKVAAMSLCDDEGKLLFTDEDVPALCEKDLDALMLILENATTFNRVSKAEVDKAKKN